MKLSDYTGHASTVATVGAGIGLTKAGYDIATGNTQSYVGKMVLPTGTKREVTWRRVLLGSALAATGVALAFGKIPFASKK